MKQIGLVWRTVRHLTARQVAYQVLNRLRSFFGFGHAKLHLPETLRKGYFLVVPDADKPVSWKADTFTFLNRSVRMTDIDWNYPDYGKLWTYNLNYFDFLNQRSDGSAGLGVETGLVLIRDFIAPNNLNVGLEPYPTSLRIVNWVQFLSRNQVQDDGINCHLYAQAELLSRRFEYHLGGNHLLENGFALLTAALYFRHRAWFWRGANLVRAGLSAQILADGGHDERSPMYHQILLDRLLDALLMVRYDTWHTDPTLVDFLEEKVIQMLGWLNAITFRNGDVPMMNDAAFGIAPTTAQLRAKATKVGFADGPGPWPVRSALRSSPTPDTGYRKFTFPRYELVANVGAIGPDHQPGHAHADTFSFVLHVDNQPLIVDSGTSTYETGPRRAWERSTAAHNTVDVMNINSSEVWAGFRVGRRARVTITDEKPTTLTARHDGYRKLGVVHERTWRVEPMRIRLTDRLTGTRTGAVPNLMGVARLHFHPDVAVSLTATGVKAGAAWITFVSATLQLNPTTYEMADGFNRLRTATCVEIAFTNYLETDITIHPPEVRQSVPPHDDLVPNVLL